LNSSTTAIHELSGVAAITKCEPDLKQVVCDERQIKQALVALLINACEAVHPGEGVITITSRYLPDARVAQIRVSDNGIGMDHETKQHIFEPFFTTKEQGKGVGLGLAVVYGIVTGHGGEIEVQSAPDCGTTFVIRLPERISGLPHPMGEGRGEGVGDGKNSNLLSVPVGPLPDPLPKVEGAGG
jgi:signal transduction histidine kinase